MRQPTPIGDLYRAWNAALRAGEWVREDAYDGVALCGWWTMRLVKGGPHVPVETRCIQEIDPITGELTAPERLVCEVGPDRERYPIHRMDISLRAVTQEMYDALMSERFVAASHSPVDLTKEIFTP